MSDNNQAFNRGYSTGYQPQRPGLLARARKVFKEFYPDQKACEVCGVIFSRFMQIHHIDGDFSNNEPLNLMKTCKVCHHEIHAFSGDVV